MKDYIRTDIELIPWSEDLADFMAALLGELGYESFTQSAPIISAYIKADVFDNNALKELLENFPAPNVGFQTRNEIIKGEDWNHEWEKNYFRPIVISDKCVVRSSFHKDAPRGEYEILVDPKMAFGTGHHSTTHLMLEYLLNNPLQGCTLIDMGTGTGILAILASMRGATAVYGIEIDPDAYANACDNIKLNNVSPKLICGDASALVNLPQADIMLANINRNIIVADLARYRNNICDGGKLVCSGFYRSDLNIIQETANPLGLKLQNIAEDNGWVRAEFSAY